VRHWRAPPHGRQGPWRAHVQAPHSGARHQPTADAASRHAGTRLARHGVALGVSVHHTIADGPRCEASMFLLPCPMDQSIDVCSPTSLNLDFHNYIRTWSNS
jgi:hypothetical protein